MFQVVLPVFCSLDLALAGFSVEQGGSWEAVLKTMGLVPGTSCLREVRVLRQDSQVLPKGLIESEG